MTGISARTLQRLCGRWSRREYAAGANLESELSFAYMLSIVGADSLAAMLDAERDRAPSESFARLASGSHVPVIEFAHIGFLNEDDLLEHRCSCGSRAEPTRKRKRSPRRDGFSTSFCEHCARRT